MRVDLDLRIVHGPPPRPTGRAAAVWADAAGRICGRSTVNESERWIEWKTIGVFRVPSGGDYVEVWPAPGVHDGDVRREYQREVAPLVLQSRGLQVVHASAAGKGDRVIAFCGVSGSGKSTLGYALSRRGWRQVSDDHLLLDVRTHGVDLVLRAFEPSLRTPSAAYFGERAAVPLEIDASVRHQLCGIALLAQDPSLDRAHEIEALAPAEAFVALLPHAHCFDPGDEREIERLTRDLLSVAERVPVHRVRYRPSFADLPRLVDAIERLMTEAGG